MIQGFFVVVYWKERGFDKGTKENSERIKCLKFEVLIFFECDDSFRQSQEKLSYEEEVYFEALSNAYRGVSKSLRVF